MQHPPEPPASDDDEVRKRADDFARQAYVEVWQHMQKLRHRSPDEETDDAPEQTQE